MELLSGGCIPLMPGRKTQQKPSAEMWTTALTLNMWSAHSACMCAVLKCTHRILCMAAQQKRESCQKLFCILTKCLGKEKVCVLLIPHTLSNKQCATCLLLSVTHFQQWQRERGALLDSILTVDKTWMH